MLKAGDIVDRYTVEGEIASGGMAEVYRVRHNQLGSVHALKVLVLRTKDIRRRLLQEGRVQAALNHPNAIMVTDVVEVDGHPGLVMEYVDGPTLGDWVNLDNPSYAEIERVFRAVVSAIGEAHRVGLIHRDLKPSNVLLARAGEKRIPKVIDFGLAKVVEEEDGEDHTRTGVPMGTPSYMAPEQIADAKNVDPRADLFSLGVLLYYMCCRRKAFSGANAVETYNAVLAGKFTPPEEVRPDIPPHLLTAISVCIQTRPDDRVDTAEDLLEVLDGREPRGTPVQVAIRSSPLPKVAGFAVAALATLGAGVVIALFLLGVVGTATSVGTGIRVAPPAPGPIASIGEGPAIRVIRTERDAKTGRGLTEAGVVKPFCGARPGVVLGYVKVPGKAKRQNDWTFDAPAPLARKAAGSGIGCTFPIGTRVQIRQKPDKVAGDHWLAVYGDAFTLPGG